MRIRSDGKVLKLAPLAAALFLTGCVIGPDVGPNPRVPPNPGPDACGASALQGYVGQHQSALDGHAFPGPVRVISPGLSVTADFIANRTEIVVDGAGVITGIHCG